MPYHEDAQDGRPPLHRVRGETPRWLGRCPACDAWGTLAEAAPCVGAHPPPGLRASMARADRRRRRRGAAARADGHRRARPGARRRARAGSVTLLGGEPGIGKSTLLLQALGRMAGRGHACLLVTAEESSGAGAHAGRARSARSQPELLVVAETSLPHVLAHVETVAPDVLAVDSIQTVLDPDLPGAPGSVTQVRECAHRLVRIAKERGMATVLVGHVTKDGTLAGPAGARAHRRHRALVRRRPRPRAADAARAEAPVRLAPTSSGCSR